MKDPGSPAETDSCNADLSLDISLPRVLKGVIGGHPGTPGSGDGGAWDGRAGRYRLIRGVDCEGSDSRQ